MLQTEWFFSPSQTYVIVAFTRDEFLVPLLRMLVAAELLLQADFYAKYPNVEDINTKAGKLATHFPWTHIL